MRRSHILSILILCITSLVIVRSARAESMNSSSYRIRFGNFNMTSGLKSSSSYALTDTVGQTAAQLFSSAGYVVKAGFQYMYTLYDFSFTLSSLAINLGTLTPSTFATGSTIVTVSAPGQGYAISTYETTRLKQAAGATYIADTTCNSGTCTETSAGLWNSTSAVGFGYNASGNDVSADFVSSSYFRPFPDLSLGELPAPFMSSSVAGRGRTATVTTKANIPGSQQAGNYENQLVFIATPAY